MTVEAKLKYPHIIFDEKGIPMIEGTTLKVIELVVEKLAYGWSPEELYFQHPYLTLGQIHATLAYYWDHADQLDNEIADRLKKTDGFRDKAKRSQSSLFTKLRGKGAF